MSTPVNPTSRPNTVDARVDRMARERNAVAAQNVRAERKETPPPPPPRESGRARRIDRMA